MNAHICPGYTSDLQFRLVDITPIFLPGHCHGGPGAQATLNLLTFASDGQSITPINSFVSLYIFLCIYGSIKRQILEAPRQLIFYSEHLIEKSEFQ